MAKKIEVEMAAIGADAAAADIRKVEKAQEDLHAGSKSGGGAADDLQDLFDRLDAIKIKAEEVKEKFSETNEETTKLDRTGRLKEIAGATGAIGVAAGMSAKTFGQVRAGFESIDTQQLRQIDAGMADQIENAKMWASALEDPIGLLLKLTTGSTVGEAFAAQNEQIEATIQGHKEQIDRIIISAQEQAAELNKLSAEIKAANSVLDARDEADAKARDRKDQAAIRGGANPEDVYAETARVNGAKELEKVARDMEPLVGQVNKAYQLIGSAKIAQQQVANTPNTTRADQEEAASAVKNAEAEYARLRKELDLEKEKAAEKRRGIREDVAAKVEGLEADKQDRLAKEKQAQQAKELREQKQVETQAGRERKQTDRERSRQEPIDQKTAAQYGREAVDLVPSSAPAGAREAIQKISDRLQDGDQGGEMKELIGMLTKIADNIPGIKASVSQEMRELRNKVAILDARVKNARIGR